MAMAFVYLSAFSQGKAPLPVSKAFEQKFPDAKKVKWEKEKGNTFEAKFWLNGKECTANFTASGEWLETESEMSQPELPEAVLSSFNLNHKGAFIKEVSKIELNNGSLTYEIEMKKGIKTVELNYSSDGKESKGK